MPSEKSVNKYKGKANYIREFIDSSFNYNVKKCSRETGLAPKTLYDFVREGRSMSIDSVVFLLETMGYRLQIVSTKNYVEFDEIEHYRKLINGAENKLEKKRARENGYEARTIDIDKFLL